MCTGASACVSVCVRARARAYESLYGHDFTVFYFNDDDDDFYFNDDDGDDDDYYYCVCVRVCVRACMRACVRARACLFLVSFFCNRFIFLSTDIFLCPSNIIDVFRMRDDDDNV